MHGWKAFLTFGGALYNFVQKEVITKATRELGTTYKILNFLTGEKKKMPKHSPST